MYPDIKEFNDISITMFICNYQNYKPTCYILTPKIA